MLHTPLAKRKLPDYTRGEEIFNMVTHIVGGGLSVIAMALAVIWSALYHDAWAVVTMVIYGLGLLMVYSVSGVYHGLKSEKAKKVMQVIDHCDIYFLIAATYTPLLLVAMRPVYPVLAWTLFGLEWGLGILAATFNAIDLKKFSIFSMVCYILMGWGIIFFPQAALGAFGLARCGWLFAGGVAYTVGAVLYGIGVKVRYMHSVFHIFVVLGSVLQFVAVFSLVV
ncbi:MAG: hemolysin III family protein [Clostridia bacterium]|nr:hemolysin III family protein [Clostridia bacterium]